MAARSIEFLAAPRLMDYLARQGKQPTQGSPWFSATLTSVDGLKRDVASGLDIDHLPALVVHATFNDRLVQDGAKITDERNGCLRMVNLLHHLKRVLEGAISLPIEGGAVRFGQLVPVLKVLMGLDRRLLQGFEKPSIDVATVMAHVMIVQAAYLWKEAELLRAGLEDLQHR